MARSDEARAAVDQAVRSPPSHDDLVGALAKVRRRGIGNLHKPPLLDLGPLLWVAQFVSSEDDEASKIEDTLERAARLLGGMSTEAVLALFGLTPDTRGQYVGFRRKVAAERYDYKTPESFRAHYEKQLLMALATQLLLIAKEQLIRIKQLEAETEGLKREREGLKREREGLKHLRELHLSLIEAQENFIKVRQDEAARLKREPMDMDNPLE